MTASNKVNEFKLAVIGLGYVGLPIALEMAKHFGVIGFDVNEQKVLQLQQGIDPGGEMCEHDFEGGNILFTTCVQQLKEANFFIVAVPTPVDDHNVPDLGALEKAFETIGSVIKHNDYVVLESTVYPGCTEEVCIPIVEKISGLTAGKDFKYGFSPERINPGDKTHTLRKVIKVVSGCDEEALNVITQVYEQVVQAGVHRTSSVKVAEAAKIIENTQRDINIALMNELSIIFDRMNINTYEVLEAAGTKWNFHKFYPGLVGGHCIGVDPYYLTYKAAELGYLSKVILAGRAINDDMGHYIAQKTVQHIIQHNDNVKEAKVLIMGVTFKENVTDIRNSKVADVVNDLQAFSLNVHVTDPGADSQLLKHEYGFELQQELSNDYDAVIIAVAHDKYKCLDDNYFASITKPDALICDIKGTYKNKIISRKYWSL